MKTLKLILAMVLAFATGFAAVYGVTVVYNLAQPLSATKLLAKSPVCGFPESLVEAERAMDSNDELWMSGIKNCVKTYDDVKIRVLSCEALTCKIRFWGKNGETDIGYTKARYLAP